MRVKKMTVKKLIKKLLDFPMHSEVLINVDNVGWYSLDFVKNEKLKKVEGFEDSDETVVNIGWHD